MDLLFIHSVKVRCDKNSETPIHVAVRYNHIEIANYFAETFPITSTLQSRFKETAFDETFKSRISHAQAPDSPVRDEDLL